MGRASTWALGIATAGFIADGLWRRSRAAEMRTLPDAAGGMRADHHFVTAAGVELDAVTRAAAGAYAAEQGLDVLELVPAALDTVRALELARRLDPVTFRDARLARGEGAGHALLVSEDVVRRAGIVRFAGLNADAMDELSVRLKRFAPISTDVVVVPGMRAVRRNAVDHRAILRRRWLQDLPTYLTGNAIVLATAAYLSVRNPLWGAALAAASCVHPYLATARTPLRPADRLRFALSRPVSGPLRLAGVALAREAPDPELPRLREQYRAELAAGIDRFLLPPRTSCPWCGGRDLRKLLVSRDYQQRKPGVFRLDRCRSCGHVFQNPRLSDDGLSFYYRDYYEGRGKSEVERGFRLGAPHYRARALMLRGRAEPRAWLDVGGGHGHFCNAARDVWPATRFDALDFGSGVLEAERRGWVDTAHYGQFQEFAGKLAGAYDVISMHHYLEHTLDPLAELDAAVRALPPGGHLLIEVPDPASPVGRLAGRWWHNAFQPQHLHLIPFGNLVNALAERGLEPVRVHRGAAHQELDLLMVVMLVLNRLAPPHPDHPWVDARHPRARITARVATSLAGAPLAAAAGALDQLAHPFIRRYGGANCYRVLARKPEIRGGG